MNEPSGLPQRAHTPLRRTVLRAVALLGIALTLVAGTGSVAGADSTLGSLGGSGFSAADDGGPPWLLFGSDQEPNQNDWFNVPVLVHVLCIDDDQPVSCPAPFWLVEGQSTYVSSTDGLGQTTSGIFGPINIDQTPPRIDVTNNGATFKQSDVIMLGCNVTDNRSGVWQQSNPCPAWGEPASNYEPGTYWGDVEATDFAGNYSRVNVNFTVVK